MADSSAGISICLAFSPVCTAVTVGGLILGLLLGNRSLAFCLTAV